MNKELLKHNLETALNNFKTAINQHSAINIKRADGGWSVGEIAGHIIKSSGVDFGATGNTERPFDQHASSIRELFLNFEMKFPADPSLYPDSKQYVKEELLAALDRNKAAALEMIDKEDLSATVLGIELPVWGRLTKYEWMILCENHIIRHTRQVNDFNKLTPQPGK